VTLLLETARPVSTIRIHYLDISSALIYDAQVMQFEHFLRLIISDTPKITQGARHGGISIPTRYFKPIHAELTEVVRVKTLVLRCHVPLIILMPARDDNNMVGQVCIARGQPYVFTELSLRVLACQDRFYHLIYCCSLPEKAVQPEHIAHIWSYNDHLDCMGGINQLRLDTELASICCLYLLSTVPISC
jgi:hypothetical protein